MKIEKMTIDNICGIKHLDLAFNSGLNLICGENGVGKTTIIKSIAHAFTNALDNFIKKYSGSMIGRVDLFIVGSSYNHGYDVTEFIPGTIKNDSSPKKTDYKLLYFSTNREIKYKKLDALPALKNIQNDPYSNQSIGMLILGVDSDIKEWFINRFLFSNNNSLTNTEKLNLEVAKNIFSKLDERLSVKTVLPNLEVVLNEGNKEIFFEMLSSGYKSCVYVLLGIIKEIEYRFPQTFAGDFDGTIMIDEIDIHLHPQWQAKLVLLLKKTFPNAQIIATTHSPSVLQNATAEEIIPLYKDKDDNTYVKGLHLGEYGLQGWTLEEIMKDVMGMESTTSDLYTKTIKEFDDAMYEENVPLIKEKYEILCKMLHPQSTLRQLLKIQMAGLGE